MNKLGLLGPAVALVLVGAVAAVYGCGQGASGGVVAEGGADGGPDVKDAGPDVSDAGVLGPPDPDGWQPYLGYPGCSFSVPSNRDALPAPPTWEDCPADRVGQAGVQCRQIALYPNGDNVGGTNPWVHGNTITVLFPMVTKSPFLVPWLVWDVDGPVRTGFRQNDYHCDLLDALGALNDGRWVLHVRDSRSGQKSDLTTGVIAGNADELVPHLVSTFVAGIDPDLAVSATFGIVEQTGGPLQLLDWNDPSKATVISANEGHAQNFAFAFGSALFWAADGNSYDAQKIYTPGGGVADFILGDTPPAAADLGTDGKDLVWSQGSGGRSTDPMMAGLPSVVNIMTAPFTTDPAKLKPRRLRSEQTYGFGTTPFVVGCGYAMRGITSAMRIVRISDGVSWLINKTQHWVWENAVALTCTEAFIQVIETPAGRRGKTDGGGLVRVRLDSLGPGIAPD